MFELILNKLKYVYKTDNNELIKDFVKNYEKCINSGSSNSNDELKTDELKTDELLQEYKEDHNQELQSLFKKINILFNILADLLKYSIVNIDDDRYKKANDEKIKFPKTLDALIIIIGCYGDAFSYDIQSELFNILELHSFNDLYKISEIHINMIPFVANDNINLEALRCDYIPFAEKVLNLAGNILNVNTDLEQNFIIETSLTD